MPWVPLDDNFHSHRKVVTAGNEAIGVHCRALSWVGANLTDGYVPEPVAYAFAGARRAGRLIRVLVDAGLWEVADGGWRIHGWTEWNPSADEVRTDVDDRVERRRRAGRAGARARWKSRSEKVSPDAIGMRSRCDRDAIAMRSHMRFASETADQRFRIDPHSPPTPPLGPKDTAELSTYGKSPGPSPNPVLGPVPKVTRARNVQDQDQDQEIAGQDVFGAVRAARERAGLGTRWWHDSALKVSLEVARKRYTNLETRELELALLTIASWRETRSPNRLVHVIDQALREAHSSNGHQPSSLPPLPPTVDQLRARGDLGNQP